MSDESGLLGRLATGQGLGDAVRGITGSPGAITQIQAPDELPRGESFILSAVVQNTGQEPFPQEVRVRHTANGGVVQTLTLAPSDTTLGPDDSQRVTGSVRVRKGGSQLRLELFNSRTGDVLDTQTVTVNSIEAQGRIQNVAAPGQLAVDQQGRVQVDVQNTGRVPFRGAVVFEYLVSGTLVDQGQDRTGRLDPGDRSTIPVQIGGQPEDQVVRVTLRDSDHDEALDAVEVTIQASPITGTITLDAPSEMGPNQDVPLSVEISNTSAVPRNLHVNLALETPSEGVANAIKVQPSTQPVDAEDRVSLETRLPGNDEPATITAQLVDTDTGRVLDTTQSSIEVTTPEGALRRTGSRPDQALPRESVRVTATLENTGKAPIRGEVRAVQKSEGDVVREKTLTPGPQDLDPGESATLHAHFTQTTTGSEVQLILRDTLQGVTLDRETVPIPLPTQ